MLHNKWIAHVKIGGFLILLLLLAGCQVPHEFAGTELSPPVPIADIDLESAAGPVSLFDFKGNYTLVYFGYTFCPDICPTTLNMFKQVKEQLGKNADELEVVMITVDPDRDSPEALAEYVGHFDASFTGLSGDKATIDQVGRPFGLYYEKQEGSEATGYLVDHTASFYLLDPEGNIAVIYPHGTLPEDVANDLEYLINNR